MKLIIDCTLDNVIRTSNAHLGNNNYPHVHFYAEYTVGKEFEIKIGVERCAVKRTNESRLVCSVRIRKSSDRIKRLLVGPVEPPRWDRFEAHFPEPASSARPQESR